MYFENPNAATQSQMSYLDVKNLAQTGEGKFLEFKRTIPSAEKIAREIAAFANTKGGTLLVGVDDDKALIGVEGYHEEEFLLNKAVNEICSPTVDIGIEVVHFGERDLLVIKVPEAETKPIYVVGKKGRTVYIRKDDQSKVASKELIAVMQNKHSDEGVTFEYGPNEQKLFRYLNEYGEITVEKFSHLIDVQSGKASGILVNLVSAGVLNLFTKDNVDYFTFSQKCET
ncbi:ATP-binding protein [Aliifodinibius sp. S!AR15-10]|uniref:AlbA family DNA-binding domain-containing protein n=1 Tax=Aliifodinibius sp. S!AR15-10 TaxID=2950437 RepID=UPI002857F8AE|nr:ATP-binding protein [Aliifodinibius sp. S!AR15-10]MDR8394373.1 ATP-binding protein [Aliifodinibius sp. S!AR15-10]